MSLFEIDINKKFKISNCEVFIKKEKIEEYYESNTLNDGYKDDIAEYLLEDISLKIHHDSFLLYQHKLDFYKYSIEEIRSIVKSDLYDLNTNSTELILYPEWLLFFIAIVKQKVFYISESEFRSNLQYFQYIAEIRYKKYIIRNMHNYIERLTEYKNLSDFQKSLYSELLTYSKNIKVEISDLYNYLQFLYRFHDRLKENEKYKLMWNLEVYIKETVELLRNKDCTVEDIYQKATGWISPNSYLNSIQIYKPLYIQEKKNYFLGNLSKINEIFEIDISIEILMEIFLANQKYEDLLFYYIKLIERFNANKISQDIMGALIKSIVLGLEEYIRDKLNCEKGLYECLKKMKVGSHKFNNLKHKIAEKDSNDDFFSKLKKIITEEEESLEKYLMLYYHARNYLAHNNIDMTQFFWGDDGKQTIISNVSDAVMIILYQLETMNKENS